MRKLIDHAGSALGALALFATMVLTFVDVAGRKLLDQSLPGSLELTELLMVLVIFAALPLVSLHGEHVVFDSLDPWLPKGLRRWQRKLVDLICALGLLAVAYLMWQKAGQLALSGDTSSLLKIPHAPFVYLMSVLAALTAAVHLMLMLQPVDAQQTAAAAPGA